MRQQLAVVVVAIAVAIAVSTVASPRAEERGQALYFGRAIDLPLARIGRIEQRGLTCAGCHGRDASGGGEGRSRIPAIHGAALGTATAIRPAYDAARFHRALTEGHDSGGRTMSIAMPRFALSATQVEALWRFLAIIGDRERTGVSANRIRIGVATTDGDGQATQRTLDDLSAAWKARGRPAIHGREVDFVAVAVDSLAPAASDASSQPFLLVAPMLDRDGKTLMRLQQAGLPVLAPHGALPADEMPAEIVSLRAGDREVAAALLALAGPRTSIVADTPPQGGQIEALSVLTPDAPLAAETQRIVLLLGEAGLRAFSAAHRLHLAGRTLVLPLSMVEAQPALVGDLLAVAADVIAARPAGDPLDMPATAAALEAALITAGRDLTRSAVLDALRTRRQQSAGVEFVRVQR
jgi:hypothetical protein